MDERVKFIARLLDGETMSGLCREFGISRKTGYKIHERYRDCGVEGLTDRSRRPYRHANQLPIQIETLIVRLKREKPAWGAPKIRERLSRLYPEVQRPAISTVHAVLDRHGLVTRRRRRRNRATGTPLSSSREPNALWCADFKGEFMLADRRYCYPLTVTDYASRYLIACEALASTKEATAFPVFESAFKEFGLPRAIRTDNGVPFASRTAFFGLSKLSVWWLRLGITLERIQPGQPQQNGRHERMHLTLKKEATKPPGGKNFLQQQAKFDRLHRRVQPGAAAPGARHALSRRALHAFECAATRDCRRSNTRCTGCHPHRHPVRAPVLQAPQDQSQPGLRRPEIRCPPNRDRVWLVSFMHYDLGYFDDQTCRLEPIANPFGAKVLPMSPE